MSSGLGFAVAFGRVAEPARAIRAEGRELAAAGAALGRQVALLRPGTPALRLNSPGWLEVAPETVPALSEPASLRALCRVRLLQSLPPFTRAPSRVLEAYLDAVAAAVPRPATTIEAKSCISTPGDRFFDALLPLANAWISALPPDRLSADGLGRPLAHDDFANVDLAFWTGTALVTVVLAAPERLFGRRRRLLESMAAAIDLRWWPDAAEDAAGLAALALSAPVVGGAASFGPVRSARFADLPGRTGPDRHLGERPRTVIAGPHGA